MRVFISHSSQDKAAVEALAIALHQQGLDPWFDQWEIQAGDDIVVSINQGLETADAGIIVFSHHSQQSRWVEAETSYLTYARIEEGKVLIPVTLDAQAWVPPLLKPLARRGITEIEAICDALKGRRAGPPARQAAAAGLVHSVRITLTQDAEPGLVNTTVTIDEYVYDAAQPLALSTSLRLAQQQFLRGVTLGLRRNPEAATLSAQNQTLSELGQELKHVDCGPAAFNFDQRNFW